MKLRKRIAAFGAAMVMAVSMMSIGVSASVLHSNSANYEYNLTEHAQKYEKDIVCNYSEHIACIYSKATKNTNTQILKGQSGCEAMVVGAEAYASISVDGTTLDASDTVGFYDDISWTNKVNCGYSNQKYVRFRGHCLYYY